MAKNKSGQKESKPLPPAPTVPQAKAVGGQNAKARRIEMRRLTLRGGLSVKEFKRTNR